MMNNFQLIADMLHVLAILILLLKLCMNTSCNDISGKSQILFCVVYCTRYLDLFTNYVSLYNSTMKIGYIVISLLTIFLIYIKFKDTNGSNDNININTYNNDSFRIEFLLIPCAMLALFINHELSFLEVMWTFSIYLEAVAILPQFYLMCKIGGAECLTIFYLCVLWMYRAFYLIKWGVRYVEEEYFDMVSVLGGIVQTALYIAFFFYFIIKISKGKNLANNLINSPLPLSSEDNLKTKEAVYSIPLMSDHSISHNIDIERVVGKK